MTNNKPLGRRNRRRRSAIAALALAVFLVRATTSSMAQEVILTLVTVQNDKGQPIESEIWRYPPTAPDDGFPVDVTNAQGRLDLSFACPQGPRIQARPHDAGYYNSSPRFCRSEMHLSVLSINVAMRLRANLEKAATAKDFAVASLIATELASVEPREGEGVAGTAAESLAVVYAEKAFATTDGVIFDPAQGKKVMTPVLQEKVRDFQRSEGLAVTGKLDYGTLSTLAGTSSGAVRYSDYGAGTM